MAGREIGAAVLFMPPLGLRSSRALRVSARFVDVMVVALIFTVLV
jgi:hypothetical protein